VINFLVFGVCLAVAWLYVTWLQSSYVVQLAAFKDERDALSAKVRAMRADADSRRREQLFDGVTMPVVPRSYVIPPPVLPAPAPVGTGHHAPELEHERRGELARSAWEVAFARAVQGVEQQWERDRIRCGLVRLQYDRAVCFDPLCPGCNPAPQDRPTGALTLPAVP